jgi:hypothetical protein
MNPTEPVEHKPGEKCGMRVTTMWAYLAVDSLDDCEGVIGFVTPDGTWMPMIASDEKRVRALRTIVDRIMKEKPMKVRLVKFENRTDVEEIG